MPRVAPSEDYQNALFLDFFYLLRDYNLPVTPREFLEFNEGLEKGLVKDLDDLFVLARLNFVRRAEHQDAFERAFAFYFFGIDLPPVAEGDFELFRTKQFRKWLEQAIKRGEIPKHAVYNMSPEELMAKFWDTMREQLEAHHGGSKWIGTGGNSPFGHSGHSSGGMRVYGEGKNRSALKVIGDRRYVDYSDTNMLRGENLRQALESLRHMTDAGPYSRLNLEETIRKTARNAGEIDLVFERDLRDRISIVLLIDNGGSSMQPFVDITRLLFQKMHGRFEDLETYYFHNTIYEAVYVDPRRIRKYPMEQILLRKPETRIIIVGDASMAPEELEWPHGQIAWGSSDPHASTWWLNRIRERFKHTCWLNPIPKDAWDHAYGNFTISRVRDYFHMEDMTLGGIRNMVEHLSE